MDTSGVGANAVKTVVHERQYFVYHHSSGSYLPGTKAFFQEIVATLEYIFPDALFIIIHPTVAIKAMLTFWYVSGAISTALWQRVRFIDCVHGTAAGIGAPTSLKRLFPSLHATILAQPQQVVRLIEHEDQKNFIEKQGLIEAAENSFPHTAKHMLDLF